MCQVAPAVIKNQPSSLNPRVPFHDNEPLPPSSPDQHHEMSKDPRNKIDLFRWMDSLPDDPALEVCEH
jgi:hypothetical protein